MAEPRKSSIAGINYFPGDRRGSHIDNGFMSSARRGSHIATLEADPNVVHTPDDLFRRASVNNPDFGGLQMDSKDATVYETTMSFGTAVKLYRPAILWSVLMSAAIIMEGYDTLLLSNFYALPAFCRF